MTNIERGNFGGLSLIFSMRISNDRISIVWDEAMISNVNKHRWQLHVCVWQSSSRSIIRLIDICPVNESRIKNELCELESERNENCMEVFDE